MREIKFRVFSTLRDKRMIYLDPQEGRFSSEDLLEANEWKVMQYINRKDKNDNPIYEGDIISYKPDKRNELDRYVVEMPDVYDRFDDQDNGQRNEIIGNRYENPELINSPKAK